MQYIDTFVSPWGTITLASDGECITGLWFAGQRFERCGLDENARREALPVFAAAKQWLQVYFAGREPDFSVPVKLPENAFQKRVLQIVSTIPRGQTMTYGEIGKILAREQGKTGSYARAVGNAVSRNPICIFIPCHRVTGAHGSLGGYAGGAERKRALLQLESGQN